MATTTLTQNPQKITAPDGNENDIDFDTILGKIGAGIDGYALCQEFSASTQLNANGIAIDSNSGAFASGQAMIPIFRGIKLKYKTSNAATFTITIVP